MGILEAAKPAIVVCTKDRARATNFYRDMLGLPFAYEDDFAAVFHSGGVTLRVSLVPDFTPHEHTILGFTVADVRTTVQALHAKGVDTGRQGRITGDATVAAQRDALENFKTFVKKLVDQVQDDMGLSGDEDPTPMSRARLSGPSRLAFRINTDDFETGDQGGRIEFTVSELTNWSRSRPILH